MKKKTSRHIACIAGIETVRKDGVVIKLSCTFGNNIKTFQHDDSLSKFSVFDARDFMDLDDPMRGIMDHLVELPPIDQLLITCHSDSEALYIFSHVRTELDEGMRTINKDTDWSGVKFSPSAEIRLLGCQTAGQKGVRFPECTAQWIADGAGVATFGFVSRSAQRVRRDGWWVQVPDIKRVEKFLPRVKTNS